MAPKLDPGIFTAFVNAIRQDNAGDQDVHVITILIKMGECPILNSTVEAASVDDIMLWMLERSHHRTVESTPWKEPNS